MLFLIATLAAASAATPSVARVPVQVAASARCPAPQLTYAAPKSVPPGLRRLGEEPPAKEYLAVDRNVGGCPAPAIVRTGIGR